MIWPVSLDKRFTVGIYHQDCNVHSELPRHYSRKAPCLKIKGELVDLPLAQFAPDGLVKNKVASVTRSRSWALRRKAGKESHACCANE